MAKNNKNQKTFVVFDSFIQAAREYSPSIFRQAVLKYKDYALYGDDTPSESNEVNMLMAIVKDSIDRAKERYEKCIKNGSKGKEHGWKGGRPKKTPEETPNKPQEKPLSKPLYEDVDEAVGKYEEEDRFDYADVDSYASGYVDVDRDDSGYEDAYATGNEDDDWDEEDYDDEDTDDYEEEDADRDEETYPTSIDTTGSKSIDTLRERVKPTFSCEKPNPILPTSKVELQREYETNLSILYQYDLNHQDFDETSRAALRGATNALMKLSNLNFEQAKQVISAARSQYRQES